MNRKKINKKGTDKTLSIYWFFVIFLVAAGVVYMVTLFYGKSYDVREIEANIISNKIADCLTEENYFREEFISNEELRGNFLEVCKINLMVEDENGWEDDQIYFDVNVCDFDSRQNCYFEISYGSSRLTDFCFGEGDSVPYCNKNEFYTLSKESGTKYLVKINTVIRKTEKND